MKNQRTKTRIGLKTIIIMMIIMLSTTLSYAQWSIDEGFEGGIIPADWTIYDVNGDGHEWHALDYPSHAHSGDWMAVVSCYDNDGHDWLITPQVTIQSGDEFIFFARAWYGTEDMNVKLSTTGNAISNFNVTLESVTGMGTDYVEYSYDLNAYAGQSIYLAIEWIQDVYGMAVDDVKVGQPEANDIGMLSIEVPVEHHFANTEIIPSGTIKNYGTTDITDNFAINCAIVNELSVTVYTSIYYFSGKITPGQTGTVTFYDSWIPTAIGDYTIKMTTNLTGDSNPNNDTISGETEIVVHYGTGGPDDFGYRWIDSEVSGGPEYNWIEISGTGTSAITYGGVPFSGDDNFSDTINFGFNFPFYGIDRTYCYIDINGEILLTDNTWYTAYPLIGWGSDGNMFNYSFPIPGYTAMPALVSVYWDDLFADEGVGDVYFQTFGTEPDRYFVVEWYNLRFCYGTVQDTSLCFEVIFHENGEMLFQYKTTAIGQTGSVCPHDNGRSSTVAIQNDDANIGLCYLREIVDNGQYIGVEPYGNLLQDSLAIRFYMGEDNLPPSFIYVEKGNTFNNTPEFAVQITDMSGLSSDSLYYNTGSGWQAVTHYSFVEPNNYYYQLPQISNSTTVNYYFAATDDAGTKLNNRGTYPANAPDSCFSIKILPTNGVEVLFATPGTTSGYQDYQNIEFPKYIMALDQAGVTYDIYNWAEYDDYSFPDSYKAIFVYSNSSSGASIHDTLSIVLMNFMDLGTNENPKNVFMASDGFGYAQHGYPNSKPMVKFYTAYMRGGYHPQGTYGYPPYGGTNGLGGPNCWNYEYGSVIGVSGSPIGDVGDELPVYANSPDVLYTQDCPAWYAGEVTNPGISSYATFLFEDGPGPLVPCQAYCYHGVCALWLDNLIYKSFYTSFDISQFTSDADINMIIADAVDWFGIGTYKFVDLNVFLEGPFNSTDTDMNTDLNSGGLIPLAQPFNTTPWNYTGTESVTNIPNANVVDWILIEYRDAVNAGSATSGTMIARQAAFLLNDGSIVGLDGTSDLQFSHTPNNQLFVVIWHRNHLSIMSANPLTEASGVYAYNYTTGTGQAYGTDAQKNLSSGIYGMIAGDVDGSGLINQDDKSIYWEPSAGTNGYNGSDLNLDTEVDNKDKDDFWVPNLGLGSQVPD